MLFTSGLYAQEAQSTVELYAGSVDQCYNVTNSYTSKISVRDFIKMKSFRLTLKFDKTQFEFDAVANQNLLLGGSGFPVTAAVDLTDPLIGKVVFTWSNPTEVTIGDNVTGGSSLFDAKFKVLNFPNNEGTDLFDSPLAWDVPNCTFYYDANWNAGTNYQVETTNFFNGTMNVPVSYTLANFSFTTVSATCAGGQATINITSPVGTGMLYYFNGNTTASTSPSATATAPSVNTVLIVDANGCRSHVFNIPVAAPAPLVFSSVTHEDPLCFNDNGEITFNIAGGTGPYTYWVVPAANSAQFISDITAQGGNMNASVFTPYKYTNFQVLKPAGTYSVAVNDAYGCLDLRDPANWKSVTIVPITSPITYTTTVGNNTCNGSTDGLIAVTLIAGGTGPDYTVSIDGIHWVASVSGNASFTGLVAGAYTVIVKDHNGCSVSTAVTVTQPAPIVFTPAYTDASCAGGLTGTISIPTVSGGTAPYTFAVTLVGGTPSTWVATTGTIGGLAANYYSVWVKDANGCMKGFMNQDLSGNILPIQAPGALTFTTNADNADAIEVDCFHGNYTLTVTAAGGKAPYTYSFDGGETYTSTNTDALTALVIDTPVSVYVKDANGCITNRIVTVNVPEQLLIYSFTEPLSPTCPGGTDGRITVNVVGGTAPYMYSSDNQNWWTNKVLALPEGATTVYVKDAKGCTTSGVITIDALTVSGFTAAPTGLIACNGNTTTQGIAITAFTWQAGRTVQWFVSTSAVNVFSSGSIFVPASVNGVTPTLPVVSTTYGAGTYYVGARDQYGCTSAVKTVVLLQNPPLQLVSVDKKDATCSTLFDGSLTINTLGGNGTPYYAIVQNPIAISGLVAGNFQPVESYTITTDGLKVGKQVVQALRGTYYVVLRDVCITDNSIWSGPYVIDGFKAIALDEVLHPVVKTNITCHDSNDGKITVTDITGGKPEFDGTGLYTYKLYMTGSPDVLKVTNTTGMFTGLLAGSYYVTITDATNCPLYKTSTVTVVNPDPLVITNVTVTHFTCATSNDGIVRVTATGGTGAYWLAVNASADGTGMDIKPGDWLAFPASSTTKPYVATDPGVYKFYVKDANGCVAGPSIVTVIAPKVITPVVAVNTSVGCNGGNDGSVQITATGGFETSVFTHTYLFSLHSDFTASNTTGLFTGLAAGTYTVYVKATNTPSPIGNYTYPMIACTYQLTFVVTEPLMYSYQGQVLNHVSCKGSNNGTFAVTVISGGTPFVMTTGGEYDIQLTTTANPTLLAGNWTRTTNKVATFSNLSHAIYSVWIKDANGCMMPTGAEVLPVPVPVDYIWHKVESWEITEPATVLTASVTWNNDVTCFGGNDGKFTVTGLGGVPPYTFAAKPSVLPAHVFAPDPLSPEWKANLGVFDQATAATWIIWVKDANGCIVGGEGAGVPVDEWRVQVRQPQQVNFNAPTSSDALCFGSATGKIMVSGIISDAGAPYTFTISGKDATGTIVSIPTYTGLTAVGGVYTLNNVPASQTKHAYIEGYVDNAYTVTVTDKNGCSNSKTVIVWQNPELAVQIVKADGAFLCPGDNNGVIEAMATGGTNWDLSAPGSYTYQLTRDGVVFTAWQAIPSFLVEVGHTWEVEVKDGNGCIKSDVQVINAPLPVSASLKETTCYSDATASVVVSATGEPGRTFYVHYRLNTDVAYSAWVPLNSNNELPLSGFIFANNTPTQNFYYFQIKDSQGCTTSDIQYSFVPTQHPLQATVVQSTDQLSATLTITGGVSPYSYQVGSAVMVNLPVDGNTFQVVNLHPGATVVTVYDAHGCNVANSLNVDPLTVTAVPVSGNDQLNTFSVVLTFNRDVTVPSGGITVTGGTGIVTGTSPGKVFTVAITADDLANVNVVLNNTITDAAGNLFDGKTFTYKVGDHVAPTLIVTDPVTPVATLFTVDLKFSEAVTGVLDGVTVTGGTLQSVTGILSSGGTEYTVTVSAKEQTPVTIVISDAITDLSLNMNKFAGQTLTYTTGDFTPPTLVSFSPSAIQLVDNYPTFKMTFSENVKLGVGGSLNVYKLQTTTPAILTIPITADMISGNVVTVSYVTQNGLDKNTRYYVLVDGTALTDMAGNAFVGVSDPATWAFKTGSVFATAIAPTNSLEFKVYPNPFVDVVHLVSSSQLSKVIVTNIAGQIVKEVVNPTNSIQLSELRSGIYFISMYNMDNVIAQTVKIVKR